MPSKVESPALKQSANPVDGNGRGVAPTRWLKVGAIAAASAVLGGLAAAWFYRNALSQLREAGEKIPNSEFGATGDDWPENL